MIRHLRKKKKKHLLDRIELNQIKSLMICLKSDQIKSFIRMQIEFESNFF